MQARPSVYTCSSSFIQKEWDAVRPLLWHAENSWSWVGAKPKVLFYFRHRSKQFKMVIAMLMILEQAN